MRISISGTRGKTTTVRMLHQALVRRGLRVVSKTTGDEALLWVGEGVFKINRPKSVLDENFEVIKIPHDIAIIENQAITPYTMKVFHRIIEPEVIAVTNVRLDHTEFLGESKIEIAKSIASSFNESVEFVINGEERSDIEGIIRGRAERIGANYIRARNYGIPCSESIGIIEEVLKLMNDTLSEEERTGLIEEIERGLSVRKKGELLWYDGSKVNDPESAEILINYFLRKYKREFVVSANFRKDRRDRTSLFARFLRDLSKKDFIVKIFVSGFGAKSVARYVGENCIYVDECSDSAQKIIEFSEREGAILMLLANRKTKLVDIILEKLNDK
ncbi:MAG: hypothetical protein LM591_03290 [Candidatus Korarchaeum sp.]|nr:hypothetical protein [Candidatus Korarchaeum sp.]